MRKCNWFAVLPGVLTLIGVWQFAGPAMAEDLHVKAMTFNIRYGSARDGEDSWPNRREMVLEVIRAFGADAVGLQEAEAEQIAQLRAALPEYAIITRSRLVDTNAGEAVPVFYLSERWQPDAQEQGTFWLSDTPEKPGSATWGNSIPRIVTWARLIEKKSGRGLYFYNVHFDHISEASRAKSARSLARHIAAREHAEPVVLTGDFNAAESSSPIRYLKGLGDEKPPVKLVDTFREKHPDATAAGTFNAFRGATDGGKIDFVFALPGVKVLAAEIVHTNHNGRYPSDHFPVTAEMLLP